MEPNQFRRISKTISRPLSINASRHTNLIGWDIHDANGADGINLGGRKRSSVSNFVRWPGAEHQITSVYDPEQDAAQAREIARQKRKNLSVWSLFRYSTLLDKVLMVIGSTLAIIGGIFMPWIFYWFGKFLYGVLLHIRCHKLHFFETSEAANPFLFPKSSHHDASPLLDVKTGPYKGFLHSLTVDFLVNVGYGTGGIFFCQYLSCRCFAWAADRQVKRISVTYFESIIRKDSAWFDTYVDREFSHLMTEELMQIRAGMGETIPTLLSTVSNHICLAVFAFYFQYELVLPVYISAPLGLGIAWLACYAQSCQGEEAAKSYGQAGSFAEEILCTIKTVKLCQGEAKQVMRFKNYLQSMTRKEFNWIIVASICSALVWFISYSVLGLAIWFGSLNAEIGQSFCNGTNRTHTSRNSDSWLPSFKFITPEGPHSFFMVFIAVVFIGLHVSDGAYFIKQIQEAKKRASDVFFLIDWKPRIDNLSDEGKLPKSAAIGRIEVKDAGAKYPQKPKEWALRHVTLSIYPGQVIGFVGQVGSGKSTLLKMISRLYDVSEGEVTLDGTNVQLFNVRWLRSQMSLVTHEPILFPESIESNLRCVKPSVKFAEIQEACKIAGVHHTITELPQGYNTILTNGHRGDVLTEQEMRRLCIARAIVVKPRILMMDDPLANEDEKLEKLLLNVINILSQSTTVIITSTKSNALMKRCDQIYVFADGGITEQGSHLQLLRKRQAYYKTIEETLDIVVESKPKFTSQLTAYRFAKSLRKIRQRKRKTIKSSRRSDSLEEIANAFHRSMTAAQDQYQYLLEHRGFGVGGFHRYTFAKTATFNPQGLVQILKKLTMKRTKRDGFKNRSSARKLNEGISSVRSSHHRHLVMGSGYHLHDKDDMSHQMDYTTVTIDEDRPYEKSLEKLSSRPSSNSQSKKEALRMISKGSAGVNLTVPQNENNALISPTDSFTQSVYYSTNWDADDISICSEESHDFWDDYCDKLEAVRHQPEKSSWSDIRKLVEGDTFWIVLGCISSLILGLGVPGYGILFGEAWLTLDVQTAEKRGARYLAIMIKFILLGILIGAAAFCQEMFFSIAGRKICVKLRVGLFASMLNQDLEWYDLTENDISILCNKLESDTDCVQHVLLTTYGVLIQNLTTVLLSILISFGFFPDCYLITFGLIFSAAILITSGYFSGLLVFNQISLMDSELERSAELSYRVITSIRSCMVLGLERHFLVEYKKSLKKPFRQFYIWSECRCLLGAFKNSYKWLAACIFVFISVKYTRDRRIPEEPNIEYIFMVLHLMILGLVSIGESLSLLTSPKIGTAAAHRILKILNSESKVNSNRRTGVKRFEENLLPPRIRLIDVCFKYCHPTQQITNGTQNEICKEIFQGINLDIQPSFFFAIVGAGQSGKTTLANLILRLVEPTSGAIFFDETDVDTLNVNCIRRAVALVEQDTGLVPDMTVGESIAFGNNFLEVSTEDIQDAAKAAQVHDEISNLKDGYDTKISSLDPNIPQTSFKQRIALARALIKNPKVIVIDDALSSNNVEHISLMRKAIDNAKEGRTLIILSQKIEPVRKADVICVLHKGKIVETGNDSDLIDLHGFYYNMYMTQRLVEETAAEFHPTEKLEEAEVIDNLKRKIKNAKGKRKSSIAYSKFLSDQMLKVQKWHKVRDEVMDEEERKAEKSARKSS